MTFAEMQHRQLRLSLGFGALFLLSVFSIPILNQVAPDAMLTPVFGIPFVWLYVGVVLHLEFWAIAITYTVLSNRWERAVADAEAVTGE